MTPRTPRGGVRWTRLLTCLDFGARYAAGQAGTRFPSEEVWLTLFILDAFI